MAVIEEIRTVTSNGRLVVPWSIQQALGLEEGGPIRFRVENGVVTIAPVEAGATEAAFTSLLDGGFARGRLSQLEELSEELETLLDTREHRPARAGAEAAWDHTPR